MRWVREGAGEEVVTGNECWLKREVFGNLFDERVLALAEGGRRDGGCSSA